jgi:ABC-type transport system involved in cytochrome c biogenesis permease subunit
MPKSPNKLRGAWLNLKSLLYAIVTLAIVIPILLGLWWLTQIVVVTLALIIFFFLYKVLTQEVDDH